MERCRTGTRQRWMSGFCEWRSSCGPSRSPRGWPDLAPRVAAASARRTGTASTSYKERENDENVQTAQHARTHTHTAGWGRTMYRDMDCPSSAAASGGNITCCFSKLRAVSEDTNTGARTVHNTVHNAPAPVQPTKSYSDKGTACEIRALTPGICRVRRV